MIARQVRLQAVINADKCGWRYSCELFLRDEIFMYRCDASIIIKMNKFDHMERPHRIGMNVIDNS